MNFDVHDEAKLEAEKAIAQHELARPGLGTQFATRLEEAMQRILAFPNAWTR